MNTFQGVVLGVVQGLAEFLPVSSSAHLTIVPRLFHWPDAGLAFDVWLHWGTGLAVLLYCGRDWFHRRTDELVPPHPSLGGLGQGPQTPLWGERIQVRGWGHRSEDRFPEGFFWLLMLATAPGAIAGYLLQHQAETLFRTTPGIIAVAMILMGLVLAWADQHGAGRRDFSSLTWRDSLLIGCSQALAVIPGVSRSGATISAALFLGVARPDAARFSFWLSLPIILGAGLVEIPKFARRSGVSLTSGEACIRVLSPPAVLGFLAAALAGFLSIHVLIRYVQRHHYTPFVLYRLLFGAFVLLALFTHHL